MKILPTILEGDTVRLEPLTLEHVGALCAVGFDESIWRWTSVRVETPDEMKKYVEAALAEQRAGAALPFATVEKSSATVVGSTRFGNIDCRNRRAEIGWTWINPRWQRTKINTEAKFLMLRHAFEVWRAIRVELKTDALNEKSQTAILRLGAVREGVLRQHMITDAGRFRDTVYFSIIDKEWEIAKRNLLSKLEK